MKKLLLISIFNFALFSLNCFAQQSKIDSLLVLLKTDKADTNKLIHLYNISDECETIGNYEEGLNYGKQALAFADVLLDKEKGGKIYESTQKYKAKSYANIGIINFAQANYSEALKNYQSAIKLFELIDDKKDVAKIYLRIGMVYYTQGDFPEALKNNFLALEKCGAVGDKKGEATSYNAIGAINFELGNYPEALRNHFLSLKIKEKLNDKRGIANSYNNIGNVYNAQANYQEAIKNYVLSLKIREEIEDKKGLADSYNNIGNVYGTIGNYTEALKNDLACLKIQEELGFKKGMAHVFNNIGDIYYYKGNYSEALKNYIASMKLKDEKTDKAGVALSKNNIGIIYTKQKKFKEAEECLISAKDLLIEVGHKEYLKGVYNALTDLDSARGDFKGAYKNHKLYILYRDSLDNEETRKKTIQSQMTYDFEKKEAITKAEQDKKDAVTSADKKKQQLLLWFLIALAIAIGFIAIVIFRGLQQSKRAKKVIELQRDKISEQKETVEHQKILVEEHQKEIVDSITYAKRIQYTLLANNELLKNNLPEHFIFFKPKDIVSGDFYWASKRDNKFYIAACDSTGHGVPGAFMSLLNISFLNEAVNEKNIFKPNEILDHVRRRLIENMDGGQDGMDAILICIDGIKLTYAAANNSPAIIKNGNLISLDADKMPVGKGENVAPFTLRTIDVVNGDSLYLYTDGYADQFGGPKGKKFKYKQLDDLLISISNLPAKEQSKILNQRFEDWKGNLEQIDDMLVIGIRI